MPGTEGPQGPPGKEGQRVSKDLSNGCLLAYLNTHLLGAKMLAPLQMNKKSAFIVVGLVMLEETKVASVSLSFDLCIFLCCLICWLLPMRLFPHANESVCKCL